MTNKPMTMRVPAPQFFKTPNDLVDHWLPFLGQGELKVLLVVLRKTFGWHKTYDKISLSQFETLTGLTRTNTLKALSSLIKKGVISKEVSGKPGSQVTYYELVVIEDSNNSDQSFYSTPPSPLEAPPPVLLRDPQKTPTKEKEQKKTTPTPQVSKVESSDSAGGGSNSSLSKTQDFHYEDLKGKKRAVSKQDLIEHLQSKGHSADTVRIAIASAVASNQRVGNIFAYLNTICERIGVSERNRGCSQKEPDSLMPDDKQVLYDYLVNTLHPRLSIVIEESVIKGFMKIHSQEVVIKAYEELQRAIQNREFISNNGTWILDYLGKRLRPS